MPTEVIMPKVDMDMATGKIVTWHVEEGQAVQKGQALFDIETDKAAMEVESPGNGLIRQLSPPGAEIAIGQPVAWLYEPDEALVEQVAEEGVQAQEALEPAAVAIEPVMEPEMFDRPRATPAARRLARETGIALEQIAGSARLGRVTAADVRAAQTLQVPSDALNIRRTGKPGAAPLFLLHGFGADAASWSGLTPLLDQGREIITPDLPCHGNSPLSVPKDFRELASLLRQTFDELGLAKVHLIGHSLGGALALSLADTRPRAVASLTLISTAGLGAEIDGQVIDGLCRARRVESLMPWLKRLVHDADLITPAYARVAMSSRQDEAIRDAQKELARTIFPDGTQAMDLRSALNRAVMPVRIIFGREDRIIPWQHALQAPGHVSLNLFAGTGHLPHFEHPQAVARLVNLTIS